MKKGIFLAAVLASSVSCGDKVPESSTSRKIGDVPKQAVDKAAAEVAKAVEQGAGVADVDKDK